MAHHAARSTCVGGRTKSGDINPATPAMWCSVKGLRELHGALGRLAEGLVGMEGGWSGRSTVVRARAAVGTPCAGRAPVNLRLGGVESERGRTVKASVGFIGEGAGTGSCLVWRGACGAERRGVLSRARTRRTRGRLFLPLFKRLQGSQTCESRQGSCANLFLAPRASYYVRVPMGYMP